MTTESQIDPIPTAAFPPAETAVATVDEYRRRIRSSCKKTVEDFFELGAVCREAADRLSKSQVETLLTELPMERGKFWKLVTIGRDRRLAGMTASLPPSFSTIYEVALLSDKQLEDAVDSSAIRPKVRRAEVAALRKPREGGSGSGSGGGVGAVDGTE